MKENSKGATVDASALAACSAPTAARRRARTTRCCPSAPRPRHRRGLPAGRPRAAARALHQRGLARRGRRRKARGLGQAPRSRASWSAAPSLRPWTCAAPSRPRAGPRARSAFRAARHLVLAPHLGNGIYFRRAGASLPAPTATATTPASTSLGGSRTSPQQMDVLVCRCCKQERARACFTPDGLRRQRCAPCSRAVVEKSIHGSEARRLLACLRARLRSQRRPEASYWRLSDVEALLARYPAPELDRPLRRRIVCRDASQPFVPSNCAVVCFGQGLRAV